MCPSAESAIGLIASQFVLVPSSSNPQHNQQRNCSDVCRRAALVIFALVVKIGRKASTEILPSTGCNSVSRPTTVYRIVKKLIPRKRGRSPLLRADKVFDLGTVCVVP